MHIFLTGMMGSGKSSVGKILAKDLGYSFIDLDEEIVKKSEKSIEEIFTETGEDVFREIESRTAFELKLMKPSVIATGGGFPLQEANRQWMKESGKVVWLKSSPASILDRIKDENRPLLPTPIELGHIEKVLDRRISVYVQADLIIVTDGLTPEGITKKIINRIS
ncbi:MAG: shikimate kinase [Candidatus Marinimicrobia bacterium]|nr:shikimate kinase [Candidatus Neomarinimicrobiota bacterium]